MSASLTTMNAGLGIQTAPREVHVCEIAGAFPNKGWLANGERIEAPSFFSIGVVNVNSLAPLPCDVVDFLAAAVQFADAVVQFDRAPSDRAAEQTVYRALAEIKHGLHEVTWSRALE